jgi:16S rRNA processing protein RimM
MADWDDMVTVGRVIRPHGLRGDVVISPDTDFVEERFTPGATIWTRSDAGDQALTIATARVHGGRAVVGFAGVTRIEDAERLAGLELRVPEETLQPLPEHTYYQHQLVGCRVEDASGAPIGTVTRVEGGVGASLLVIEAQRGEILVPLTLAICTEVDVVAKRIRIDPPEGLLDVNDSRAPTAGRRQKRRRRSAAGSRQETPGA